MADDPTLPGSGPMLHIDDDWKAEAQREKQRLAAKREAASAAASPTSMGRAAGPSGGAGGAAGAAQRERPKPGEALPAAFEDLVNQLTSRALMAMGAMPDPQGRAYVSLEVARQQIDLLDVLEQKTAGNLQATEKSNLASTLHELRTAYLDVAHALRRQTLERGGAAA